MSYFCRTPDAVPLFHIMLSLVAHDGPETFAMSFKKKLIAVRNQPQPAVAACATCFAPLLGLDGIEKLGYCFCSAHCQSSHSGLGEERALYLRKYWKTGFQKLDKTDHRGDDSWKRKRGGGGGGFGGFFGGSGF